MEDKDTCSSCPNVDIQFENKVDKMKLISLLVIYIVTLSFDNVQCANILALYHVPSPSHQFLGEALIKGLSAKGHTVTLISPYKLKTAIPNCKHIVLDAIVEKMEKFIIVMQGTEKHRFLHELFQFMDVVHEMAEETLNSTAIRNLRKSNDQFDLVLLDSFFNTAFYGLGAQFQAPVIVACSSGSFAVNHITGNPAPFSFVPNMLVPFPDRMSFFQRTINSLSGILGQLILDYIILPDQEMIYNKYFKDGPRFEDLSKNVALVLVNTHVVLETPRPYMPNMIPIGGYHVEEPKKLPKDLQTYLDTAEHGVVYCSLGSNIKSADLPEEKVNAFIKAFARLKQKVLWKWESESMPNKPHNIKIAKWLPQRDVLAHPNVKAFITHGGILSKIEAVISGVPLIGIPFFGDQTANVGNTVTSGYGLGLLFEELTEESLSQALDELLYNPKYSNEIKRRSAIIRDQPVKPLASAIYWIEHVLRHGGGRHLYSAGAEVSTFQYLLLDVVAVCVTIMIIFLTGFYYIIKRCFSRTNIIQRTVKEKMK